MSESFSFLIRDGVAQDVGACLALDHSYETDVVWQMSVQQAPGTWQVSFKTERLPRTMSVTYPIRPERIVYALQDPQHGFLVAAARDEPEILGYVIVYADVAHGLIQLQDLMVARQYRRRGIGKRLLNIARRWARDQEGSFTQMIAELQTKNFPAIQFYQQHGFTFCGFNDQYFSNQDIAVFFGQGLR